MAPMRRPVFLLNATLAQLDDVLQVFVECVATEPNRRTINVDKMRDRLAMHDGIGSTHECQTWNKDFVIWLYACDH